LVTPSDGSTAATPVIFKWKAAESGAPAEGYELFVDDTPVISFSTPVTTTTLDISPGAHTWYVMATNAYGASSPSETWNVNVIALPDAPTLATPADNTWTSGPVEFTWQAAETGVRAEGFIVYIDDVEAVTLDSSVTTVTLDVGPWKHTWYVVATSSYGKSLPSEVWTVNVYGKVFLPLAIK
jgi:hypothetical protein